MSQFNIDNLQSFYWIVKLGSIIGASEHLKKSQPALSAHVKNLEEFYGTSLFSRTKAGVKLTGQGKIIYNAIEKPIGDLLRSKDFAELGKEAGPVHILAAVGFGSQWLVKFLDEFLQLYPEININLDLKDISHPRYIDFDKYDVIICLFQHDRPDIIQNELIQTQFNLYASQAYLDKYGYPKDLDDLENHKVLATYNSSFHDQRSVPYDWIFYSQKDKKIKPYLSINSTTALAKLCADGVGIAPIVGYQREIIVHQLKPIFPETEYRHIQFYYSYHKNLKKVKRVTALYDFLMKKKEENFQKFIHPYST